MFNAPSAPNIRGERLAERGVGGKLLAFGGISINLGLMLPGLPLAKPGELTSGSRCSSRTAASRGESIESACSNSSYASFCASCVRRSRSMSSSSDASMSCTSCSASRRLASSSTILRCVPVCSRSSCAMRSCILKYWTCCSCSLMVWKICLARRVSRSRCCATLPARVERSCRVWSAMSRFCLITCLRPSSKPPWRSSL
mmetsp:Transcript_22224/g.56329  ORF Transcript_22224/g.56329 Transcript_22224/m.56329 type:complete len:200 (+) Transcript_22224:158-757(+)